MLLSVTPRPKNPGGDNPLVLTFVRNKIGLVLRFPPSVIHKATCLSRLTSLYLFKACKHFWRHKSCVKEITFARCHNVWTLGCVFICVGSFSGSQSFPECIIKASEVLLMMLVLIETLHPAGVRSGKRFWRRCTSWSAVTQNIRLTRSQSLNMGNGQKTWFYHGNSSKTWYYNETCPTNIQCYMPKNMALTWEMFIKAR